MRVSPRGVHPRYVTSRKWASREVVGEFLWIYGTPNQFENDTRVTCTTRSLRRREIREKNNALVTNNGNGTWQRVKVIFSPGGKRSIIIAKYNYEPIIV